MTNIPHVSQILAPYSKYDKVPQARMEEASYRGTLVHATCLSKAQDLWFSPLPEAYQGYFDSFEWWFSAYVEKVHLVETTLYDYDLGFQGTPDLIVTMNDDVLSLIDLKTPLTKQRTWCGQLASYKHLAIKNGYPIERCGSLQLKPDGKPATLEPYMESADDFSAFCAALIAYRYFIL